MSRLRTIIFNLLTALILFYLASCGPAKDRCLNETQWIVKNQTSYELELLSPFYSTTMTTHVLLPGEDVCLTTRNSDRERNPVSFEEFLNNVNDEDRFVSVCSKEGTELVRWTLIEVAPEQRHFFNETSWSKEITEECIGRTIVRYIFTIFESDLKY